MENVSYICTWYVICLMLPALVGWSLNYLKGKENDLRKLIRRVRRNLLPSHAFCFECSPPPSWSVPFLVVATKTEGKHGTETLFSIPDESTLKKVTVGLSSVSVGVASREAGTSALGANGLTATWVALQTNWAWGPCWRQAMQPL